ncbi:MAG TPA: glycosyltransferase 87 family protein [Acidimicrobiia bacterium]
MRTTIASVRRRSGAQVAVGASSVAIATILVGNVDLPVGLALTAVGVPFVAWLVVLRAERAGEPLDVRLLVLPIAALLLLAVALAPTGSHDVWSYVMYGRIVAQHGASAYATLPSAFPHDPFLHLVARGWRHTPSVYGPVFVMFSAAGSAIAGSSTVLARLYHQIGAAIAVAIALRLIWGRTKSAAAVMLLGLNPLVIVTVVNGGHNDALVGLAVLGAVLLATDEHPAGAGVVLALGALIKVTALLALPMFVGWLLYRYGRRAAGQLAGAALATVFFGYALFGSAAVSALNANRSLMSRSSPWQIVRALLHLHADHRFAGISQATWLAAFGLGSVAVVGALALLVAWRRREDVDLAAGVAFALAAYVVAGIYALPWYCMWFLPVAALSRRRPTLVSLAGAGLFLEAVYAVKDRALPHAIGIGWWWLGAYAGPVLVITAFVVVAFRIPTIRPGAHESAPALAASGP